MIDTHELVVPRSIPITGPFTSELQDTRRKEGGREEKERVRRGRGGREGKGEKEYSWDYSFLKARQQRFGDLYPLPHFTP